MKFIYPARISRTERGTWRAVFPDLAGCTAEGDTVEEAVKLANEAACDWISRELSEEDGQLPPVTDVRDMELEEDEIIRNICVNIRFTDGWDE